MPVITPCDIRPAAPWAALCAARSVEPPLVESWAVVEGRRGVPALARLSVAPRAVFKVLHFSTAPMRIACVADGPEFGRGDRTFQPLSVANAARSASTMKSRVIGNASRLVDSSI